MNNERPKRYTEGICQDGAAILDNGEQITITEILNRLNSIDKLEAELEELKQSQKELVERAFQWYHQMALHGTERGSFRELAEVFLKTLTNKEDE